MKVRLRGLEFDVTREEITASSGSLEEGYGRKYAVVIKEAKYPPKDVIMDILKEKVNGQLLKIDFTTEDAARILRRLGFKITVKGKKAGLSSLAGIFSFGGDSVSDSEKYYE